MDALGIPEVPRGSGEHPVALVVISSGELTRSKEFYSAVFGWEMLPLNADVCACTTTAQQACALRAGNPEGFPAMVPFIAVPDVDQALADVVAAGGVVEKPKWKSPVGEMARYTAPGGTVYGLIRPDMAEMAPATPLHSPLGPGPKPPAGSLCALELYAASFVPTAQFFKKLFGWGTLSTMPSYMAFDTGAGASGIFQSHTPALPAVAYIYANDVAAKLSEIEAAGGTRMGDPMSMPGMGTFGYFTDPTGTSMGLIGP